MMEDLTSEEKKAAKSLIKKGLIVLGIILVLVFLNPLVKIGAGERGVVLNYGAVQNKILGEGLNLIIPVYQSVEKIDVKTQINKVDASSYSFDQQVVTVSAALNFHLNPQAVNKMYQEIGSLENVNIKIIEPNLQSAVKEVASKYTAQGIIENREKVKDEIRVKLLEFLKTSYVIVEQNGINVTDLNFDDLYEKAVRDKMIAQQNALTEKNNLEKAKYVAEQRIAEARGEAEAIKIQAEAITQQGGKDYVMLQWIKAWEKGGAQIPKFMISGNGNNPLLLDLGNLGLEK